MQPKHKKTPHYTCTHSYANHLYTCPHHTLPTIITTRQQKTPAMHSLTHQPNHAHTCTDAAHKAMFHRCRIEQNTPCTTTTKINPFQLITINPN